MNHSIGRSVDSDLMRDDSHAILLLKILSCLPAGTTKANLRLWAPTLRVSMIPCAIATLSDARLLAVDKWQYSESPFLFVHPVVQSYMQQRDRIENETRHIIQSSCCQYVLDHACRKDDPAFPIKSKRLAAEDINIQAILYGSPAMQHSIMLSDRAIEALTAFSWYQYDTTRKPNVEIAKRTVSMAKAFGDKR